MKRVLSIILFVATCFSYGQLTQNFESGTFPPTGWTSFDNGVGTTNWNTTTSAALTYGGTGISAFLNKVTGTTATTAEEYLVTSQVTVPANGQLRFYTRTGLAGDDGSAFSVRISTTTQTGTTSFTNLQTWNENTLNATYNIWEEKVVSLSTYAGQNIYIAFVRTNENGDRWLLDNINVVQSCNIPTAPVTTNLGVNSVSLGWTGPVGATQWQYEVALATANFTGVPTGTATSNPFPITGLTQGTAYKFQVRAICPSGFPSEWSVAGNFTTLIPGMICASPIVVGTLPYQTTNHTINFADLTDVTQPLACAGTATNYMQGNEVFYSYTPTTSGNITITSTPTSANSSLLVYGGCSNVGVSCLAGVANTNSNPRVITSLAVTAGQTYIIVISSSSGTVGYTLVIQEVNCLPPASLTASSITTTTATLGWTNPSNATSWEVALAPAPYALPSGSGTTVSTNPYIANGLLPGLVYQYYVRASCGNGTFSQWAGPFSFITPQVPATMNYTDGFETLTGWTLNNASQANKWVIGTAVNNGGTKSLYVTNDDGITNAYTTNAASVVHAYRDVTVPVGATQINLAFDWRNFGETGFDYVRAWIVPGTFTPTPGTQITASAGQRVNLSGNLVANGAFTSVNYTFNATAYAGTTMRVVFEWRNDTTGGLQPPGAIDNVVVTLITCPKPTLQTVTATTTTTATLGWTAGNIETQWEVIALPVGSPAPTASSTGTIANSNPFTLTGLTAATNYVYYVRAVCGVGDVSFWEGPKAFSTKVCEPSNQCNYSFVMTDSGSNGWQGNTMNVVQSGVVLATIGSTFTNGAGPVTVTVPICADLPFQLFWNSGGTLPAQVGITILDPFNEDVYIKLPGEGSQNTLLYNGVGDCIAPTCPKPQTLTVTSITQTSAQIGWTEMGTATQWEIVVQPIINGAPTGLGTLVTTNPYIVTGLNPATQYEFYVRARCSSTDASAWTGPKPFNTQIANDECSNATVVLTNNTSACTNFAPGILIGATASAEPNTCAGTDDDDVWFQFIATKTTHTISINNITGSTNLLNHVVYSGATCGTMTQLYCSTATFSTAANLTIGQTYKVRVYSSTATPNQTSAFEICIGVPPLIMDNTTYTVQQLVTDILIGSPCAQVSNITWKTGNTNNFGSTNGIAYFTSNSPTFDFASGIVMSTGDAMKTSGPNTTTLGDGNQAWTGDTNLEAIILTATGQAMNSRNATVIEFDFVPLVDTISFDFLFASEEYGTFQCSYSDAFAFLLTNQVTNTTTNLAVVPNTTTPISVVTVRDAAYNTGCASVNPQYFDVYNVGVGANTASTNYNGQVVPLTATSSVVPFTNYHIKMVIADRSDNSYDSAVFLEEGSFNIGQVELGDDLLAADGEALCPGESLTLDSGLAPNLYTFQWLQNGQVIPNQTGSTLNITTSGTYSLSAQYGTSTCFATDSIVVEFHQPMAITTPQNLTICNSSGFGTFNLTQNTSVILNSLNPTQYVVTYHISQADAQADLNPITNANAFTNISQWNQTVYARIKNNITGCVETRAFNLLVQDLTPQFSITSNFSLCAGTTGTITVTPTNYLPSEVTYSWSLNGNALTATTPSLSVTQAGTYTVLINRSGCVASGSTLVSIIAVPVADNLPNVQACDQYVLPVLTSGNSYRTAPNGGGNTLSPGTVISSSQTIYIFAQTATNPNCTAENSFNITIVNSPQFTLTGACEGNHFVLTAIISNSQNYTYQWFNNSNQPIGTNSNTLQVEQPGTYTCSVSNISGFICTTSVSQLFENIQCQIQKGISPNGDGFNDYLELTAERVEIFNRYGGKVYSKDSYHNDWFGQSDSGSILPDGTYYYVVRLLGGELKTGWIYINKEN